MSTAIVIAFIIFFGLRLWTLAISIKNEKRLKQAGGQEHGQLNSLMLAILHIVFYVSAFVEGYINQVQFDWITILGLLIYGLSMAALFHVIQQLSSLWTVKLIIAKEHRLHKGFLFKYVRHPNYFLNIIPELIGLVLVMKSYLVLAILFPIYLVPLTVRIIQEERLMRATFSDY